MSRENTYSLALYRVYQSTYREKTEIGELVTTIYPINSWKAATRICKKVNKYLSQFSPLQSYSMGKARLAVGHVRVDQFAPRKIFIRGNVQAAIYARSFTKRESLV